MMKTEIQIPEQLQGYLDAVNNVPNYWAEMPLEALKNFEHLNRKLVVTGFEAKLVENDSREMLTIQISQQFNFKNDNSLYKIAKCREWIIYHYNRETLRDEGDQPIYVLEVSKNEEGEVIEEKQVPLTAPSIKYIKWLLLNKKAHISDLFDKFMGIYYELYQSEIDIL